MLNITVSRLFEGAQPDNSKIKLKTEGKVFYEFEGPKAYFVLIHKLRVDKVNCL